MSDTGIQVCPVCKVKIIKMIGGDRVIFSAGSPGTRGTLWARVCQYTESPACINKDKQGIGVIQPQDYYQSERQESKRPE